MFFCAVAIALLSSCEDNDNETWTPELTTGIYVLNAGGWSEGSSIDGNLSYYDAYTGKVTHDVFYKINQKSMGNTCQDMIVYGSKMYASVTFSNVIYVLDKQGKVIEEIKPLNDSNQPDQPRSLIADNGKVYVSLYSGYVAKIDTTTLKIEAKVKVGSYPEDIVIANNKLYVANSGQGTDNTVSVINLSNFQAETPIEVIPNPVNLAADKNGNIYVMSMAIWGGTSPDTVQKIDARTGQITSIGTGTQIAVSGNKLYIIYIDYSSGSAEATLKWYDISTGQLKNERFVAEKDKNGNNINLSMASILSIDPVTNNIYIGASYPTTNGDMYIFSQSGEYIDKFDTGGLNPMGAFFVTNK